MGYYNKPKISVIIPTFNAERHLERCLRSIADQDYPKENIEIIISDGNSTDKTLDIAEKYGCKIFQNSRILAEPGKALGARKASGGILFFIDSDNELTSNDWLSRMVKPLENPNVYAVFTRNMSSIDDKRFTKYFNLLQNDPFSWYVCAKENPRTREKNYPIREKKDNYIVFDFDLEKYLFIALAQGFGVRSDFKTLEEIEYDDILPVVEMIKKNLGIAYVPDVGIYHHTLDSFNDFMRKFHKRIRKRISNPNYGYQTRLKYMSMDRKLRQYMWFLYSLTLIGPSIDTIKGIWRDRSIYWGYHPFACFGLSCLILGNYFAMLTNRTLKRLVVYLSGLQIK